MYHNFVSSEGRKDRGTDLVLQHWEHSPQLLYVTHGYGFQNKRPSGLTIRYKAQINSTVLIHMKPEALLRGQVEGHLFAVYTNTLIISLGSMASLILV